MYPPHLTGLVWVKSSYSGENGNCVEVARVPAHVAVRDSKNPGGPLLVFPAGPFAAFTQAVKNGSFERR